MKLFLLLTIVLFSYSAFSQTSTRDLLLEHLAGNWLLEGTIAGKETRHDVTVEWVLEHQYLQMHEVSREMDSSGEPAYEAIVYFGWDQRLKQYGCLWLDITGGGAFSEQGIGRGTPRGNEIPFLFKVNDTSSFHTTFVYDTTADTWKWMMDDEENGKLQPFARVTLTRKK